MFNASLAESQNFFFPRFVSRMWLLPQNPCLAACKHLLIFPHRNISGRHLCSCRQGTRSNTNFSRLAEITADRKHGATLHRQRKCSQAECLRACHDLWEWLSKAVTRERAPVDSSWEKLSRVFLPLCPIFKLSVYIRLRILEALPNYSQNNYSVRCDVLIRVLNLQNFSIRNL